MFYGIHVRRVCYPRKNFNLLGCENIGSQALMYALNHCPVENEIASKFLISKGILNFLFSNTNINLCRHSALILANGRNPFYKSWPNHYVTLYAFKSVTKAYKILL